MSDIKTDTTKPTTPPKARGLGGFVFKLVKILLLLLLIFAIIAYSILSSERGSKWLLDTIGNATGMNLGYHQGNLIDGVHLSDMVILKNDKFDISVDKAYVQIGWRAVLLGQTHVRSATIGTLKIHTLTPPTGEPFSYQTIQTPLPLRLDNATIKAIVLSQTQNDTVTLNNIHADSITWANSDIVVNNGSVRVDAGREVQVFDINGMISLTGDYPLDATATAIIPSLKEHHIGEFSTHATGSLRRTSGSINTLYNNHKITGDIVIQSLDEGVPMWANLAFDEIAIPYATDQDIRLSQGTASLSGVVSNLQLRFVNELTAKDVPNGQYQGRATITPNGMTIESLTATTSDGVLTATGQMDWQDDFVLTAKAVSQNYQLAHAMPKAYQAYQEYVPSVLDGAIEFGYQQNDNNHTRYQVGIIQNSGETVRATISQYHKANSPWLIDASWRNLYRKHIKDIGELNSPSGTATLKIDDKVNVQLTAKILALSALPQGDYTADVAIKGDDISVNAFDFKGNAGDIKADGVIALATAKRPLSYQLNLTTSKWLLNEYLQEQAKLAQTKPTTVPFYQLSGKTGLSGSLRQDGDVQVYDLALNNSDITMDIDKSASQTATLKGDGKTQFRLKNSDIVAMSVDFGGRLLSRGINDGLDDNALELGLTGNLQALNIHKLTLSSPSGHVSVGGDIKMNDGIDWKLNIYSDNLNTSHFYPSSSVIVTGDLATTGRWVNDKLQHATGKFDGKVLSDNLPSGDVSMDAIATGNKYTINRLHYQGQAGQFDGTGWVDVGKGMVAQLDAKVQNFNVGQFIKNYQSQLSGVIKGTIDWQANEQNIDIDTMDITGTLNGEPALARGKLAIGLQLPKDLKGYVANLRKPSFDLDRLMGKKGELVDNISQLSLQAGQLQDALAQKDKQLRRLIKTITAQDVNVAFGGNRLTMAGNEQKLAMSIDLADLHQIYPSIRGQVAGDLVVVGDSNSLPTIYSDLTISNISMPSFALRQGSVLAKVVNLANDDSSMVVQGVGLVVANRSIRQARLDTKGTLQNHTLSLFINDNNMQLQSRLQGGLDDNRYTGVLSQGRLQTRYGVLNQLQPTEVRYLFHSSDLAVAPHCWQTLSANQSSDGSRGTLCVKDTLRLSPIAGDVDIAIKNLDTTVFTPLLPSDLSWKARLNGAIDASWGKHEPSIQAILYSDNGEIGLRSEGLPDTTMGYERVSLIAQTVATGLKLRTDIKAGQAGDGYVDVTVNPEGGKNTLAGAMVLNSLNLNVLRPFFPALQSLEGMIDVAGGVGGTLSAPLFYGNANLSDGRLAVVDVPMTFDKLQVTAQIRGMTADLTGSFVSGDGEGKLAGLVDWQKELYAKLSLKGDNLVISSPPLLSAKITPDIEVLVRPERQSLDVKGVVSIPVAVIRPPETTDTVISQSGDVTVIDRRNAGDVNKVLQSAKPWSINADIGVDLGDEVVFKGFGASLPLAGALHLTQSGQGAMKALGVVQVSQRTNVEIIGQSLDLNYGQIRFNGDMLNPSLSAEAVRQISGQTVGVRISDKLSNPNIRVFNDAGLSEEQAMNALATGSLNESTTQTSTQEFRTQVTNNLAAAGLSLGLQGTRGITNDIGRALGLESLVVDASGNSTDTNVNVTGYITPDLYIRYGVGVFSAETSLSMRYQLTRRVYVEATSATEKVVNMVYRWRF